ncbi:MAG TPA: helix-turn-helix transcriptional regulator [Syntrophales bacterium]|nr:helix-turn-helix transcriptional regulator [Syntrophales bacterium]
MNSLKITMKAARVNVGLRQDEAAKLLGITVNNLALFEKMKAVPAWEIVNKMSEIYKIPVENLLFTRESA